MPRLMKAEKTMLFHKKKVGLWTALAEVHDANRNVTHVDESISVQVVFRSPVWSARKSMKNLNKLSYVSHVHFSIAVDARVEEERARS